MSDHTLLEKLLNLPEFMVTDFKQSNYDMRFFVEKKDKTKPSVCPNCGTVEPRLQSKGYYDRELRDINIQDKLVGVVVHHKKYKCMECRKIFSEPLDCALPKEQRTTRFTEYITKQAIARNFLELERETGISDQKIKEIFMEYADKHIPKGYQPETPVVLGIDEIHIQKQGKHRKQPWAVIGNGDQHTVIDVLENRNKATIISYLNSFTRPDKIKVVTMDMWPQYKEAVYEVLPRAVVIVDKFHVQKMGNEALNTIRKGLRIKISKKRNSKLKNDRYLLLSREHNLQPLRGPYNLTNLFNEFPVFKVAHKLKEDLFKFHDCPTREDAVKWHKNWKASIPEDAEMEPFREIASTIDNWSREILNYFDHPDTNAFVEGMNRAIRGIEDHGYGYSYEVLRAKVILGVGHKKKLYSRPKYGINVMTKVGLDIPKYADYGMPFDAIIDAINAGLF